MPSCLVIDESEIVAKVAARILEGLDVETVGARTVATGLFLFETKGRGPDIVLLSGSLSENTVEANVRALRAAPGLRDAAILVSIVETNLGLMTRAKRAGANGFVFRPFDRASLLAWVERHLPAYA